MPIPGTSLLIQHTVIIDVNTYIIKDGIVMGLKKGAMT